MGSLCKLQGLRAFLQLRVRHYTQINKKHFCVALIHLLLSRLRPDLVMPMASRPQIAIHQKQMFLQI